MKYEVQRKEYTKRTLDQNELGKDPLKALSSWLQEAYNLSLPEPNAAVLATANKLGRPTSRSILIKEIDDKALFFYTNLESRKASDLKENPYASLTFLWKELERQVTLEGKVFLLSREESFSYFKTRPRESQLAAWASCQGKPLSSREELLKAFEIEKKRFENFLEIPLPDKWGGFKFVAETLVFWQGRENRLHDRFLFVKEKEEWKATRIAP